jgi:hypothetical protein
VSYSNVALNSYWLRTLARVCRAGGPPILASAAFLPTGGCSAISANVLVGGGEGYDASTSDGASAGTPADASSCHPGSVETFVPKSYRAAAVRADACTDAQIRAYFDACFGSLSSAATCSAFGQDASADATCGACIRTSDSASRYGPLVGSGSLVRANVAGCIELTEPSLLSCAKAVQAESACELAACEANCPVTGDDPSSQFAFDACAAVADTAGCSAYVTAPQCNAAGVEGGVAASGCLRTGADAGDGVEVAFREFYDYAVPLFCGANAGLTEPADASASEASSSDASSSDASSSEASSSDASPTDAPSGIPRVSDAASGDASSAKGPPGDASSSDGASTEPNDAKAPLDAGDGGDDADAGAVAGLDAGLG